MVLPAVALGLAVADTSLKLVGLHASNEARKKAAKRQIQAAKEQALQGELSISRQAEWEAGEASFSFSGVNLDTGSAAELQGDIYDTAENDIRQLQMNLQNTISDIESGADAQQSAFQLNQLSTLVSGGSDVGNALGRFKFGKKTPKLTLRGRAGDGLKGVNPNKPNTGLPQLLKGS